MRVMAVRQRHVTREFKKPAKNSLINRPELEGIDLTDCICCGSGERFRITANRHFPGSDIVRCAVCGLVYPYPRPAHQTVANYYRDSYYDFGRLTGAVLRRLKLYFSALRARNQFDWIVSHLDLPSTGRVLEVGSGYGRLLELFHNRGWNVDGIEPSRDCMEYTTQRFRGKRARIFQGTLEEYESGGAKYDLLVLSHVFEHFVAPENVLRRLESLLRPGGFIFFELPNADNPHYRQTEYSLIPDFYFFNASNFESFVRNHGLEPVHLGHVANRWLLERYDRFGLAVNYVWWTVLGLIGRPCFRDAGHDAITLRALVRKPLEGEELR